MQTGEAQGMMRRQSVVGGLVGDQATRGQLKKPEIAAGGTLRETCHVNTRTAEHSTSIMYSKYPLQELSWDKKNVCL